MPCSSPDPATHASLSRVVEAHIAASRPLSSADLFALATDAYGGTLAQGAFAQGAFAQGAFAQGAFAPCDAYDCAELGLHLLRTVGRLPPEASGAHNALASGAAVHANELSDRWADLLAVLLGEAGQGPAQTLTRENADHPDAILPMDVRGDVVTMNPPRGLPGAADALAPIRLG